MTNTKPCLGSAALSGHLPTTSLAARTRGQGRGTHWHNGLSQEHKESLPRGFSGLLALPPRPLNRHCSSVGSLPRTGRPEGRQRIHRNDKTTSVREDQLECHARLASAPHANAPKKPQRQFRRTLRVKDERFSANERRLNGAGSPRLHGDLTFGHARQSRKENRQTMVLWVERGSTTPPKSARENR